MLMISRAVAICGCYYDNCRLLTAASTVSVSEKNQNITVNHMHDHCHQAAAAQYTHGVLVCMCRVLMRIASLRTIIIIPSHLNVEERLVVHLSLNASA